MQAIALTDTNNLFGAMEFTKKALEKRIQPILGANFNVKYYNNISQNIKVFYNITCLIMNEQGWQNLSILVSSIYKNLQEHKHKFVSFEDLLKYHNGLIILFDDVSENVFLNKDSEVYTVVKKIKNIFKDRIYLNIFKEHKTYRNKSF